MQMPRKDKSEYNNRLHMKNLDLFGVNPKWLSVWLKSISIEIRKTEKSYFSSDRIDDLWRETQYSCLRIGENYPMQKL